MEQDLGSCIFTVVYFIVYFVLHGPTLRLVIIGLIVLVQFSFQVQYPKSLWDPINKVMDALSSILDGPQDDGALGPDTAARAAGGGRRGASGRSDTAGAAHGGRAAAASRRLGAGDVPALRIVRKGGAGNNTSLVVKMLAWGLFGVVTLYFLATFSEVLREGGLGSSFGGGGPSSQELLPKHSGPVSLKQVKEADRLCDEAQKSEHDRNWQDVQAKLLRALQVRSRVKISMQKREYGY